MRLRQHGVGTREMDGETVVLDLVGSRYLSINASGTVLLRGLRQHCDEEELTRSLVMAFEVAEVVARRDVRAFLQDLEDLGLLDHAHDA